MSRNRPNRPRSVLDVLRDRGVRFHYSVDSAEGSRTPFDRATASRRAAKALDRLARTA